MKLNERFSPERVEPDASSPGMKSGITISVDVEMGDIDTAISKAERLRDLLAECDERQQKLMGRFG